MPHQDHDVRQLHRRAQAEFTQRVHRVGDAWAAPTPCAGWTVRDLVNHLVSENRWTPHLLAGETMEEVGDRFEGDLLGDDPVRAWDDAAAAAARIVADADLTRTVHLSFGDHPAGLYLWQLFADHLVHAWDLAHAIGDDERLDRELVAACADWFVEQEPFYREAGVIGERVPVSADADAQTQLLAAFGRSAR